MMEIVMEWNNLNRTTYKLLSYIYTGQKYMIEYSVL